MSDVELLTALQDDDAFRRLIDRRLSEAMADGIGRINEEEDDRIIELLGGGDA